MSLRFSIRDLLWLAVVAAILMTIAVAVSREWTDYCQYMSDQIRASDAARQSKSYSKLNE
jgi:hypothetical protein